MVGAVSWLAEAESWDGSLCTDDCTLNLTISIPQSATLGVPPLASSLCHDLMEYLTNLS